jgi:hypothetical protein
MISSTVDIPSMLSESLCAATQKVLKNPKGGAICYRVNRQALYFQHSPYCLLYST